MRIARSEKALLFRALVAARFEVFGALRDGLRNFAALPQFGFQVGDHFISGVERAMDGLVLGFSCSFAKLLSLLHEDAALFRRLVWMFFLHGRVC